MAANNQDDLQLLERVGREAAPIALRYFKATNEVWMKPGDSPVSQADMEVDNFLRETLRRERPAYGWLSEETEDDESRLEKSRVFVVDPIDGTRGFLNGSPHWCISIAIVEDERPVVGVLICPALDQVFTTQLNGPSRLNGEQIAPISNATINTVTGSKKVTSMLQQRPELNVLETIPSLAYRVAMIATGEADAIFAHGGARDWDLAAADIIASNAGGALYDANGEPLRYNQEKASHRALIASSINGREAAIELAKSVGIIN